MSINRAENPTCARPRRREQTGCEESDNNSSNTNESSEGYLGKFGRKLERQNADWTSCWHVGPIPLCSLTAGFLKPRVRTQNVYSENSGTHTHGFQNGKIVNFSAFWVLSECAVGSPGHGPNALRNPLLYSNSQITSPLKRQRKLLPKKS